MKNEIKKRIAELRSFLRDNGVSAFIVPSTDPHSGEYVPSHWETRKWLSGFTGSAGTVVITTEKAGLWTDSRYFLQADKQLEGTGILLFKDRLPETPTIAQWLEDNLKPGSRIGIDGWVNATSDTENLRKELQTHHLELTVVKDPFDSLWTDRPPLPSTPVFVLDEQYAGCPYTRKLHSIREQINRNGAEGILISALDEIAWTLNMRGSDIHCNPVFISYLLITKEHCTLYISPEKLTDETRRHLAAGDVRLKPYHAIEQDLKTYSGKSLQLSPTTNYALYKAASSSTQIIQAQSPVALLKAIKNETEIAGFRQAMKRDGAAMVKFLIWLKEAVKSNKETEASIDKKLYELRASQPLFKGISFDTIAGYQEHGAIVHYEATPETAAALKADGLLLLDSGAQYLDGTTDITRTIPLGAISEEQKRDYTLVLKGFIALSQAEFPAGTCGTQLDVLARQFMWKAGINYGHGTGHGVGHFLNVHEGPHQIRMNHVPTPLQPGMTVTNEPGIYRAGRYGIRIENTMLVVPARESEFGNFYTFEPLTLCPIDKEAICPEMLTPEERDWLNAYHAMVYDRLHLLLTPDEQTWLKEATAPF